MFMMLLRSIFISVHNSWTLTSHPFSAEFLVISHFIYFVPHPCHPWVHYLLLISASFVLFFIFYLWLHWVFIAACGFSLVAESSGYSSLQCTGFSLWWLLLLRSVGSRACGHLYLWVTGSVAARHVGSSWTRDQTHVPCIGRWILNHWITRELPHLFYSCWLLICLILFWTSSP